METTIVIMKNENVQLEMDNYRFSVICRHCGECIATFSGKFSRDINRRLLDLERIANVFFAQHVESGACADAIAELKTIRECEKTVYNDRFITKTENTLLSENWHGQFYIVDCRHCGDCIVEYSFNNAPPLVYSNVERKNKQFSLDEIEFSLAEEEYRNHVESGACEKNIAENTAADNI